MQKLILLLIFVLLGCQNVKYSSIKNPVTDFSKIATFYCGECEGIVVSNMPLYDNQANRNLIQTAIVKELTDRGYSFVKDSPDMVFEYLISRENKIDTVSQRTTNYRYWAGFETDMYNYKKGTIFVNMIDSGGTLIWQGSAESVLDKDPKDVDKKISKFIEMIFKDFPPKVDQ